jgi:hypothetical protein
MAPERLLPCLQEPVSGAVSWTQSISSRCFFKIHLNLSSQLYLRLPNGFFSSGLPTETVEALFSPPVLHVPPT